MSTTTQTESSTEDNKYIYFTNEKQDGHVIVGTDDPSREIIMLHEVHNNSHSKNDTNVDTIKDTDIDTKKDTPLSEIYQLTQENQEISPIHQSESPTLPNPEIPIVSEFVSPIVSEFVSPSVTQSISPIVPPTSSTILSTAGLYSEFLSTSSSTFHVDPTGNVDIQGDLTVDGYSMFQNGSSVSGGLLVNDTLYTSTIQSTSPMLITTPLLQIYKLVEGSDCVLDVSGNSTFNGSIVAHHITDNGITQLKKVMVQESVYTPELHVGLLWIHSLGIMKQNPTYLTSVRGIITQQNLFSIMDKQTNEIITVLPRTITHIYIPSQVGSIYLCTSTITPIVLTYMKGVELQPGEYDMYVLDNFISV